MRAPKGFGKRYFTLSAIQAYAGSITLQRCALRTQAHHLQVSDECDEAETPEDEELLTPASALRALPAGRGGRPCHCNRFFHRRTCTALRDHARAKTLLVPYRHTFSTLSPPSRPPVRHMQPKLIQGIL